MPAAGPDEFQYAIWRVVPSIERGECMNAGVILLCRSKDYLGARVHLDPVRLGALDPAADPEALARQLRGRARIAAGDADAGPIARLGISERFHQLTAPSSTTVQPSAIHTGVCADPAVMLDHLHARLVTGATGRPRDGSRGA